VNMPVLVESAKRRGVHGRPLKGGGDACSMGIR